jgi:hypothetical protein
MYYFKIVGLSYEIIFLQTKPEWIPEGIIKFLPYDPLIEELMMRAGYQKKRRFRDESKLRSI